MEFTARLAILLLLGILLNGCQSNPKKESRIYADSQGAAWPTTSKVRETTPLLINGVQYEDIATSFIIESYNTRTTQMQGYIALKNLSLNTSRFLVCVDDDAFGYHVALRDINGKPVRKPAIHRHWAAKQIELRPMEIMRIRFEIKLSDHFCIAPGRYLLLFIYNEAMLHPVHSERDPMIPWASEVVVLSCE